MREFETLRAYIPPLTIVAGSEFGPVTIGSGSVGDDYTIEFDG